MKQIQADAIWMQVFDFHKHLQQLGSEAMSR